MKAEIARGARLRHDANKTAVTAYKEGFLRWEPWKALSAAFGAGLAVASGLIAAIAWVITHWPHP